MQLQQKYMRNASSIRIWEMHLMEQPWRYSKPIFLKIDQMGQNPTFCLVYYWLLAQDMWKLVTEVVNPQNADIATMQFCSVSLYIPWWMQGFLHHLWCIEGTESCVPILCAMSLTDLMVQYCHHGLLLLSHPTIPGWLKNHWHTLSIYLHYVETHISQFSSQIACALSWVSVCLAHWNSYRVAGDSSFVCWWLELTLCRVFCVFCRGTLSSNQYIEHIPQEMRQSLPFCKWKRLCNSFCCS